MTLQESLRYLKTIETKRWTKSKLILKYIQFKLLARKGTEFLLPGPTSTSHPYGFVKYDHERRKWDQDADCVELKINDTPWTISKDYFKNPSNYKIQYF